VDPGESDVSLAALELVWLMDTTDQLFRPTRGIRMQHTLRLGADALGGDTEFLGLQSRAAWYVSPIPDHVFSVRAGFETLDPIGATDRIPLPMRVALGGQDTLRGFAYRSISPRDAAGIAVGGLSMWWACAEYLRPVPGISFLDLAAYVDAGDVSEDAWRLSGKGPYSNAGLGLLIRAENFPVRLDAAVPLSVPSGDPENERGEVRFSFSVGYRF
jgi:outer membrane protein assembly factor BamA